MENASQLAADYLEFGSYPSVRTIKTFVAKERPPVVVDTMKNHQMALPLSVDMNNFLGSDAEQLLFSLVPSKSLRNPNHPANVAASIGAEYCHVETTIPRLALTITADVKHKCTHFRPHRMYREYHKKLALAVTETELRCAHQVFMLLKGQRYGFASIIEARSKKDPSNVEYAPRSTNPFACFVSPIYSLLSDTSYVPIEELERADSRNDMDYEAPGGFGRVNYLASASSGVFGPDPGDTGDDTSCAVDAVVFQRTPEARSQLLRQLIEAGREEDLQRAQKVVFENASERDSENLQEIFINYCRGFTQQMQDRLEEISTELKDMHIVCSQATALVLYAIGRIQTLEQAMRSNAQDVYDLLQTREMAPYVSEWPDYEPPRSACVFSVKLPQARY